MSGSKPAHVAVFFVCAALLFAAKGNNAADENEVSQLHFEEIPTRVKLIGRLGNSLGADVVTIRGKWKESQKVRNGSVKADGFAFVVSKINGKDVPAPIALSWDSVRPVVNRGKVTEDPGGARKWTARWETEGTEHFPIAYEGDDWEMVGFEDAHITGWPRAIARMFPPMQSPNGNGELVITFRPATVRIFGKPHKKEEPGGYSFGYDEPESGEAKSPERLPSGSGIKQRSRN
jgi:hypothetical protein